MTKKKLLKVLAIATIATSIAACSSGENKDESSSTTATTDSSMEATQPTTQDVKANASYTIGFGMGSSISNDPNLKDFDLNKDKVMEGFNDAINSRKEQIPQAQLKSNMEYLQSTLSEKMNAENVTNFAAQKDEILKSDLTPRSNVKDPKVIVYEFFDYQCMFCSKISPELEKVMKNNNNVEVVFVEFPIFGNRWEASQYAAEVGTAVYKLNGSDAYVKYHNAIFDSGKDEGKLEKKDVEKAAKDAGADMTKVEATIKDDKIADHLKDTMSTGFEKLGIQGTPFLVVAPADGDLNSSNTTVIGGYTEYAGIQKAIDKAQSQS